MNLFRKQVSTIGLDIGTSMIKAVRMTKKADALSVDGYAVVPIEEGAIQSGEIKNPSSIAASVSEAVKQCGPADKYVVVALPNFSILSEVLMLDLLPDKQISQAVQVEAERISPFDISEVEIDYSVLECNEETKKMRVLMVAAKQDIILSYIDFLSEAGVQPSIFDVDLFALLNIFHLNYDLAEYPSSILINIGTESTVAAFLQNGVYHSSRDISVAGSTFQKELAYLPDISPDKMHDIMSGVINESLEPEMIANALNKAGKQFANAVGVAVSYFQTFDNVEKIDFIAVAGGYAHIPGLINMIELRTGAVTTTLDPFRKIGYNADSISDTELRSMGATLSVAMGLASRNY